MPILPPAEAGPEDGDGDGGEDDGDGGGGPRRVRRFPARLVPVALAGVAGLLVVWKGRGNIGREGGESLVILEGKEENPL